MGRWHVGVCGTALLSLVACGETRRDPVTVPATAGSGGVEPQGGAESAGSGGSAAAASGEGGLSGGAGTAGAGGRPPAPLKDGVPIGDCKETEEARPAGCPAEPPTDQTSCEAPDGLLRCPYEIRVEDGRASQAVYFCHPDQLTWGSSLIPCGRLCPAPDPNQLELDVSDCESRVLGSCDSGSVYAFETDQQLLDSVFDAAVLGCVGEVYGVRFQVEVQGGCPSRVSSSKPFSDAAAQCFRQRLGSVRWDCAQDLSCTSRLIVLTAQ